MLHRLPFRAMGSEMLAVLESDSKEAPPVLQDVPNWFEEWEQVLSRFRFNSELTRLNQTLNQLIEVSPTLWDVFQAAVWAEELSGGLVTPTILDSMIEAGYNRPFDELDRIQSASSAPVMVETHPLSKVITNPAAHSIMLPYGIHLDFGGVAKGWAAHQAMKQLEQNGPCLVNAGGDIAISGPRLDGSAWAVGVSNPFEAGSDIEVLYLKRCGVASSGRDRRHWERNGIAYHHIIDPQTGLAAETDVLRVTVVAPTVMEAETAAKTAFILGMEKGFEWIESKPLYEGVMIHISGEMIHTAGIQNYLQGDIYEHAKSK